MKQRFPFSELKPPDWRHFEQEVRWDFLETDLVQRCSFTGLSKCKNMSSQLKSAIWSVSPLFKGLRWDTTTVIYSNCGIQQRPTVRPQTFLGIDRIPYSQELFFPKNNPRTPQMSVGINITLVVPSRIKFSNTKSTRVHANQSGPGLRFTSVFLINLLEHLNFV